MPFRHATWVLLLLVPMIGVAFWPQYFADVPHASFTLHAHGLTASAWIALTIAQTWSIHTRRNALHKRLGLAIFVVIPLFTAGGLLAIQSMAAKTIAGHPFYKLFGPILGLDDAIATIALLAMVRLALVHRRQVWLHAGYMLSTIILVLPPIIVRLIPALLPVPPSAGPPPFDGAYLFAELSAGAIAAILAWRYPKARRPFAIAAGVTVAQAATVELFGRTAAWGTLFFGMTTIPAAILAIVGIAIGAVVLWSGWRSVPPR